MSVQVIIWEKKYGQGGKQKVLVSGSSGVVYEIEIDILNEKESAVNDM